MRIHVCSKMLPMLLVREMERQPQDWVETAEAVMNTGRQLLGWMQGRV